jgi:hypothetical protein
LNKKENTMKYHLLIIAIVFAAIAFESEALAQTCRDGCNSTNTFQGINALTAATGADNTAFGYDALFDTGSGYSNTGIGALALLQDTVGVENTAVGVAALYSNIAGNHNTAVGVQALQANTNDDNTAVVYNALYSNQTGIENTATGAYALQQNTGSQNTANGYNALASNTIGGLNTATGLNALFNNTTGNDNTAAGSAALVENRAGNNNTASGVGALEINTTGSNNTATGTFALSHNTTGGNNIALGYLAGTNLTTGSNNIDIGANVLGNAAESNKIRIGKQGTQNGAFVAGISGVAVTGSTVVVNTNGKLGVTASSARFKEKIQPMDKVSEAILALKPVTFRYTHELDPERIPQFGLVAEDVEKVNPNLVARDDQGKPYTVRYEAVNAMLLDEFLKEHLRNEQQESTIGQLKSALAQQQKQISALSENLQRVNARLETTQPALRVAENQ